MATSRRFSLFLRLASFLFARRLPPRFSLLPSRGTSVSSANSTKEGQASFDRSFRFLRRKGVELPKAKRPLSVSTTFTGSSPKLKLFSPWSGVSGRAGLVTLPNLPSRIRACQAPAQDVPAKSGQDAVFDEAQEAYESAAKKCKMLAEKACEKAQLVWNKTKDCADAAWSKTGGAVCRKAKEALKNAKEAYDEAKEALTNVKDKIKQHAKYIVNYKVSLAQAANAVVNGVKIIDEAWDDTCDGLCQKAKQAREQAKAAYAAVERRAHAAWDATKDEIEDAKKVWDATTDAVCQEAQDAYDNAQLKYHNAKAAFYKRANQMLKKTKQSCDKARETAKKAYEAAAAALDDAAEGGKAAVIAAKEAAYNTAKLAYEGAAKKCQIVAEKACEKAHLVWNKTKNCADAAWNKGGAVCSKAKQALKNAKEALKNEAKEALENAKQAYDEAKEGLENATDKIKEHAKYIVNYQFSLADACYGVKNAAGQAVNAVANGAKTLANAVANGVGSWATAAWNSLCFRKSPDAEAKPAEDDQTEKLVVTCRTCGLEGESCKCGTGESRRPSLGSNSSTNGNLDKETSDLENQLRDIQLAIDMTDLRENDLDAWSDPHLRAELVQQAEKLRNEILKLQSSKLRDEYEEEQIRRFETAGKHKPRVELEPYCPEIASGSK